MFRPCQEGLGERRKVANKAPTDARTRPRRSCWVPDVLSGGEISGYFSSANFFLDSFVVGTSFCVPSLLFLGKTIAGQPETRGKNLVSGDKLVKELELSLAGGYSGWGCRGDRVQGPHGRVF